MSFTTFWGHVEELLATGEQRTEHTKPFFFSIASASGLHKLSTRNQPKYDAILALTSQRRAWVFALPGSGILCKQRRYAPTHFSFVITKKGEIDDQFVPMKF
ncbi:hypothetical protein Taro_040415 [Colocasia esculenta]|uniref:Uncharacterized protein n=1 Tax=Colocasia esculenta TaxID=4460 RepID=A0A843WIN9_COLES|nr:hypothetical protein [Colocasia esculenta]